MLFDANGRPEREIAVSGDGPGEFRNISWIGRLRNDGFAVWDRVRMAVSFYDANGDYLDRTTYPAGALPGSVGAVLQNETALVEQPIGVIEEDPFVRRRLMLSLVQRGAPAGDSVFVFGGPQLFDADGVLLTPPGARRPHYAVGTGSDFVYSPSEPFELLFLPRSGCAPMTWDANLSSS